VFARDYTECEAVRNSIFWELRYEKHENQMKGCGVELRVSDLHDVAAAVVRKRQVICVAGACGV